MVPSPAPSPSRGRDKGEGSPARGEGKKGDRHHSEMQAPFGNGASPLQRVRTAGGQLTRMTFWWQSDRQQDWRH